jgi:hypothetical protein
LGEGDATEVRKRGVAAEKSASSHALHPLYRLGRRPVQSLQKVRRRNPDGAAGLDHPRTADAASGQEDRAAEGHETGERMLAPIGLEGVLQNFLLSTAPNGKHNALHRTRHVGCWLIPS